MRISDTLQAGFEPGLKLDIADFYPSVTEHLLERSIEYAQSFATIEHKTLEAILLTHKSLLFSKDEIWVKKDNSSFDVTIGSFDGAEICEIPRLYFLDKLSNLLGKENVGLCRDDGLTAIHSCSGPIKIIHNKKKTT